MSFGEGEGMENALGSGRGDSGGKECGKRQQELKGIRRDDMES